MENLRDTLISLHLGKYTGRVKIIKDQVRKIIFFKNGIPTFVESNVRAEALGQMLLQQGKLTQEQYDNILQIMKKTNNRQGEIIVELGYLSGFEVYEALKSQSILKFQNCFLMGNCEIILEEGAQYLKDLAEFPFNFLRAYLDIAIESEALGLTEEQIKCAPQLSEVGKAYIQENPLQAIETKWLRKMDGRNSLEQILNEFMGNEREINSLVQVFLNMKMIEMVNAMPQRFQKKASDVHTDHPNTSPNTSSDQKTERKLVDLSVKPEKKGTSELYTVALDLDQPYTKLLRIAVDTPKTQIKLAYDNLIRKLQLDSIDTSYNKEEEKKLANRIFDQLTLAYTVMSDTKKKDEYVKLLSEKKERVVPPPKVIAEVHCQKAKLFISKRKYDEAEKEIRKSMELDPEESSYIVELASLLMVISNVKKILISDEVEKHLKHAIKLNSSNAEAFFELGVYYKMKHDLEKAMMAFSKMNEVKPNDPRANAELRLLSKKVGEKKSGESSFMKLFKKKDDSAESKKMKKRSEGEEEN